MQVRDVLRWATANCVPVGGTGGRGAGGVVSVVKVISLGSSWKAAPQWQGGGKRAVTNRNSRVASLIAWAKTLFGYENRVCLKDKSLQDQWDLQTEQIWIRENSSKLMFWLLGGHVVGDFLSK